MVFAYGLNDDFIIAKQRPRPRHPINVDEEITNRFIIELAKRHVYGPLDERQYLELRKNLGMPEMLDFSKTVRPYRWQTDS